MSNSRTARSARARSIGTGSSVDQLAPYVCAERTPARKTGRQLVVVAERVFTVAPTKPNQLAIDAPIKVHETRLWVLDDPAPLLHTLPACFVAGDTLSQLAFEASDFS